MPFCSVMHLAHFTCLCSLYLLVKNKLDNAKSKAKNASINTNTCMCIFILSLSYIRRHMVLYRNSFQFLLRVNSMRILNGSCNARSLTSTAYGSYNILRDRNI